MAVGEARMVAEATTATAAAAKGLYFGMVVGVSAAADALANGRSSGGGWVKVY